jgi:hypothetical protein
MGMSGKVQLSDVGGWPINPPTEAEMSATWRSFDVRPLNGGAFYGLRVEWIFNAGAAEPPPLRSALLLIRVVAAAATSTLDPTPWILYRLHLPRPCPDEANRANCTSPAAVRFFMFKPPQRSIVLTALGISYSRRLPTGSGARQPL